MGIRGCLLVGASLLCWACGDGDPAEQVDEHRAQWLSKQPGTYVVEICGSGFEQGCTLSAVSAGEVVAARASAPPKQSYEDVEPRAAEPIVALFDRVSRELRSENCDLKSLNFDAQFSYVSDFYCSWGEEGGGQAVKCFMPDTIDLNVCAE
jgi:hypothetical protein